MFDCFRNPFDALQPGIPRRTDCIQLRYGAGELRGIDPVEPLPAGGRHMYQTNAVESAEVFRDSLTGYG